MSIGYFWIFRTARKSRAPKAACGDGIFTEQCLHARALRVGLGPKARDNTVLLIGLQYAPQERGHRNDQCARAEEIPKAKTRTEQHGHRHKHKYQRRAEVALQQNQSDDRTRVRAELQQRERVIDLFFEHM